MKYALIIVGVLAIIVAAILIEAQQEPPENLALPTGPSTVLRGFRRRAMEKAAKARREKAMALEQQLKADGGAAAASH